MYQLTDSEVLVLRLADNTSIPKGHRFWDEYEAWVAAGGVAQSAPDRRRPNIISRRNALMRSSDWTQLPDSPLTPVNKAEWVTYRQALRNLPQQPGFPDVPLPAEPTLPADLSAARQGAKA